MPIPLVVPATLSNLGPGFDVLGMALSLYNQFDVSAEGPAGSFHADDVPGAAADHLLARTVRDAERAFGTPLPHGLRIRQRDRVPWSRGLGSSATARVAGYIAWSHYAGQAPPLDEGLDFLAQHEGHPDNVVAAMLGGITAGTRTDEGFRTLRIDAPPRLRVALCIPAIEVSTEVARGVLPPSYSRADAVFNGNRLAFLVHGLVTGDPVSLRVGQEDRLHHPYRRALIGPVDEAIASACAAGAASAFISGSGSTLAAFVLQPDADADAIAAALAAPFRAAGTPVETLVVTPSAVGAWSLYQANAVGFG
ncbi:MAG: homoserine kinase [Alphaproteobacteria bacterium]|nr:homoserine kinase [Alphaproteobacteria bacterium]